MGTHVTERRQDPLHHHLRLHPFLRGLSDEHIEAIAACAGHIEFASGDVIFNQGESAERFFLIRTGMVALHVRTDSLHDRRIQMLKEGDVLGWSWLFPPHEWAFDATAETPVRAIVVDGECLKGTFDTHPRLGLSVLYRIAEVMADRLQASRRQVTELSRPRY